MSVREENQTQVQGWVQWADRFMGRFGADIAKDLGSDLD